MKTFFFRLMLCALLWLAALAPARAVQAGQAPPAGGQQVLVLLRLPPSHFRPNGAYADSYGDGAGLSARRRIVERIGREHGLTLVTRWPLPLLGVDCFVMAVPAGQSAETVAAALTQDPEVASAEPMHVYEAQAALQASAIPSTARPAPAAPNDPLFLAQPAAGAWRLAELHGVATGRNIRVAVIDSMIEAGHPDLAGQVRTARNFVMGPTPAPEQHGTGVAGIIAAIGDNRLGIVGVAPHARLMALRACWQQPGSSATVCDTLSLAKALHYAIDNRAEVINLSLSGPPDMLLGRLLDVALARGVTVVGAVDPALKDGGFPASHAGVVAVSDDPASTVVGAYVAPGRDVPTTQPGGRWSLVSGSSYAAAHVSGLFALMRERGAATPTALVLVTSHPGGGAIDACATLLRSTGSCVCACARPSPYAAIVHP
jgi:hypothetical protein